MWLKLSISASSSRFSNAIVIRYDTSSTLMAHDVIRWQNANWKIARSKDKRVSFYSNLGFSSSSLWWWWWEWTRNYIIKINIVAMYCLYAMGGSEKGGIFSIRLHSHSTYLRSRFKIDVIIADIKIYMQGQTDRATTFRKNCHLFIWYWYSLSLPVVSQQRPKQQQQQQPSNLSVRWFG